MGFFSTQLAMERPSEPGTQAAGALAYIQKGHRFCDEYQTSQGCAKADGQCKLFHACTICKVQGQGAAGHAQGAAKKPGKNEHRGRGKGGKRLCPFETSSPRRGEHVREDRPGVKYVDPESTDTGETEVGTASVAPRIADVYPEPPGTGATEGYSRGHDSRSGRATTRPGEKGRHRPGTRSSLFIRGLASLSSFQ